MDIRGEITLRIEDENYDFSSLSTFFKPNKYRIKGELISGGKRTVPKTFFSYILKYDGLEDFKVKIDSFTNCLKKNSFLLNEVKKRM